MTNEQAEVIGGFIDGLLGATADGGRKRATGSKPSWKVDQSHEAAIFSHLRKWKAGEKIDPDTGRHTMWNAAWRCAAIAWQEEHPAPLETYEPLGGAI